MVVLNNKCFAKIEKLSCQRLKLRTRNCKLHPAVCGFQRKIKPDAKGLQLTLTCSCIG